MTTSAILGYPRMGVNRELKRALEDYWAGKINPDDLRKAGKQLRLTHWKLQQAAGVDVIPSNDFSFYDQMLDTAVMVGAVPKCYAALGSQDSLTTYFAMARGIQQNNPNIPAM